MITTTNPANGRAIETYRYHDNAAVARMISMSAEQFAAWRRIGSPERVTVVKSIADRLRLSKEELAAKVVEETGKPVRQAEAEIDKSLDLCAHYASNAERYLAERHVADDGAGRVRVRLDPLGPILAIMPWNYPVWQVFRAVIPALLAGNTVLLKHAAITTGTGLLIEGVVQGGPEFPHLVTTLRVSDEDIAPIIAHPSVRGVTVTGSVAAGQSVAALAGASLKPSLLELGGSDAFIVFNDSDVAKAASAAVTSRMLNGGQSCIAAKRFIVSAEIADDFIGRCLVELDRLKLGDPADHQTDVGPLARLDIRSTIHDQVIRTVGEGAQLVTGGVTVDRPGFYYSPTILDEVRSDMTAAREETFGPVFAIIRAASDREIIETANNSTFGLGASVWTTDPDRANSAIESLDVGQVFVNRIVQSDPKIPFGGTKDSGIGRELGEPGIATFTNMKTVAVAGPTGASGWKGDDGRHVE